MVLGTRAERPLADPRTDDELAVALAEAERQGRFWIWERHALRLEDQRRRALNADQG